MRANEIINEDEPMRIKLSGNNEAAKAWIQKVYAKYPGTFQNNHVMTWGEGDAQQFAMFELVPSFSRRGAVEVKWFQAYPLRQGVGSRAMKELQALAREDGIELTLFPWDKGVVSQSKLTKFYKGQGFKPIQKGGKSMYWAQEKVAEDSLTELFQPTKTPWKWEFKGSEEAFASFYVGDIPYLFHAYQVDLRLHIWDVSFKIDSSDFTHKAYGITGTGNAATVMSIVVNIIKAFLVEYKDKVDILNFSSEENSRTDLYARMVQRLLPTWNMSRAAGAHFDTNFVLTSPDVVSEESYQPPTLNVGDEVFTGKFKNRKAEIKGFTKDKHNQPVLKTNKGPVQLFKPRIAKLVKEAADSVEKPMTQCSSQDLQKLLGRGKTNALIKHPWFQRYNNYEHAFKHGVDRWGFTKVEVYPFFSSVHTTAEGRLRPLTKLEFTFSYGGTKVVQVEEWYRAKEPDDNERRMGPGAGWRHMKTWATDKQDTVDKAWDKHWDNKEVKEEELTEYEQGTPASDKIITKLKSLGYEQLGGGLDATVWSKDAGSVVKILMPSRTIPGRVSDAERGFLTFYEFCQQQDSPNLPKFVDIGGAHHTVFEIDGIPYRQIAMERLKPLTPNSFESYMIGMLADLAKMGAPWGNIVNMLKRPSTWENTDVIAYRSMPDMVKRKFADPETYKHWGMLYITIGRLYRAGLKAGLGWDLHGENVMQRADGTVVITDPYYT